MSIIRRVRTVLHGLRRRWYNLRRGVTIASPAALESRVRIRVTDGARLDLQPGTCLSHDVEITVKHGVLEVGAKTYVGPWSVLCARDYLRIGRDCLIAEFVVIRDQNHAIRPGQLTRKAGFDTRPITIGNNVWIGTKATILPGVNIGDNAIIGANSVVTQDVPANTVYAGVPARKLRDIGVEPVVDKAISGPK